MSLTEDDKQWMSQLMASFQNRLAEQVVQVEHRLNQQAIQLEEQLNQQTIKLEERLNQQTIKLEERLNQQAIQLEERLNQRIERVETSLLTEFHKWASPAEARNRTISAALRAIDLEMEQLSDRVKRLEGGTTAQ